MGPSLLMIEVDSMFERSQRERSKHTRIRLAATYAGYTRRPVVSGGG